jgi:hypothetical protein
MGNIASNKQMPEVAEQYEAVGSGLFDQASNSNSDCLWG